MIQGFTHSIQLDIRSLKGKRFKIIADTIRSAIKNEHGYQATAGLTDTRFRNWLVVIRFHSSENRSAFENNLSEIIAPTILQLMKIKRLRTVGSTHNPVRMAVSM